MRSALLAVAFLMCTFAGLAPAEDFTGHWEVTRVVEPKGDGFPWSREVKYPQSMTLEVRGGRLVGHYTDQSGYSDQFELVAVINHGHDLLLVNGGAGTKDPESFSPIHHAKLRDGKLHAVVTTNSKLFEWVAEPR